MCGNDPYNSTVTHFSCSVFHSRFISRGFCHLHTINWTRWKCTRKSFVTRGLQETLGPCGGGLTSSECTPDTRNRVPGRGLTEAASLLGRLSGRLEQSLNRPWQGVNENNDPSLYPSPRSNAHASNSYLERPARPPPLQSSPPPAPGDHRDPCDIDTRELSAVFSRWLETATTNSAASAVAAAVETPNAEPHTAGGDDEPGPYMSTDQS